MRVMNVWLNIALKVGLYALGFGASIGVSIGVSVGVSMCVLCSLVWLFTRVFGMFRFFKSGSVASFGNQRYYRNIV